MAADDAKADFGNLLLADHCSHDSAAFVAAVHLVAGLQRLELGDVLESPLFEKPDALGVAAAFGLRDTQVAHVFGAILRHRLILEFHSWYYTKKNGRAGSNSGQKWQGWGRPCYIFRGSAACQGRGRPCYIFRGSAVWQGRLGLALLTCRRGRRRSRGAPRRLRAADRPSLRLSATSSSRSR